MNFRYRLMQFLSGRYGNDMLSNTLFIIAFILAFVNLFVRSVILQLIVYAVIIYAFFRMLSRNTAARQKENIWFKNKIGFLKKQREFYNTKRADKLHIYKKCPMCKAVLRLPLRPGVHKTVCPRCSYEFTVKVKK